jgi:hypothetical protein
MVQLAVRFALHAGMRGECTLSFLNPLFFPWIAANRPLMGAKPRQMKQTVPARLGHLVSRFAASKVAAARHAILTLLCGLACAFAAAQPQITSPASASGSAGSPFFYQTTIAGEQFTVLDPTKTFLINSASNQPQFCAGEDAWDLIVELSNAQVETYLSDRASRGFNCIWVALADNTYQTNPPQDYYGNVPFDGADFTNEDATYWSHVDYVLGRMMAYGMTAFAAPAFVGETSADGYYNSYQSSSDATLVAYGAWLANRYSNYPNIVWALGGDTPPAFYSKVADIATGIRSADSVHLITMEGTPQGDSSDTESSSGYAYCTPACASWLNVDWNYNQYQSVQFGCSYTTATYPLPNLLGEAWYEGEHSMTELEVREEGYWGILSGCTLGNLFGNDAIWTMGGPFDSIGATWQSQLGSVGSVGQAREGALFRSREFWKLLPDTTNTYLTAGFGSGTAISVLSRTSDGQTMIAYIPNGDQATVSINMAGIVSSTNTARGWWFNPQTGATTNLGTFSNNGSQKFVPPDGNDWVLVLDDNSAELAAPGTTALTTASQAISYGATGLPSGLSVNTSTGLISGTPTAAGTSTATLTATNSTGTGTATLTLTVASAAPLITSASAANGTAGAAFSYQITASNSPTSYGATGLPSGLSVNTSTGLISGTPTAAGTSTVALSATNSTGTGSATLTLTVASAASTGISFVQEAVKATPGSASSLSFSFSANTLPGDLILVAFDFASGDTPASVTDSQGNTFTAAGSLLTSPGGSGSRVYYAPDIKGGADTVTIQLTSSSAWIEAYLTEYAGVSTASPIDAQAGAAGSASKVSSGTAATSTAGDLIYGYCVGDWACTAGSGFAARSTFNGNLIEDMTAPSAGSYAATASATSGWTMQMVALKP